MFRRIGNVCLLATLACLLAPSALFAQAQENPYKKADVGDWVSYAMKVDLGGQELTTTMKQTLKEKNEKEATVAIEVNAAGQVINRTQKIPLDKPYDPAEAAKQQSGGTADVEKLEETEDSITVGGKTYKCKRIKLKLKLKQFDRENISTIWVSPEVPLSGLVKLETDFMGRKIVMELSGTGKK